MGIKARSARGEVVDFDLLKIKEQIAAAPAPTDVKARQNFVDKRLRRRVKKATPAAPKPENEEAADPKMPAPETLSEEPKLIDEVKEEPTTEKNTKQKARPRGHRRERDTDNTEE